MAVAEQEGAADEDNTGLLQQLNHARSKLSVQFVEEDPQISADSSPNKQKEADVEKKVEDQPKEKPEEEDKGK